jgi:PAS domain S-box-containing protein
MRPRLPARIFPTPHGGGLVDRLKPHSLRAQLAVALTAMALLVVAGGATAFVALFATGQAARQFSQEQQERAQITLDLQQRPLQIELLAERMTSAESQSAARAAYARILEELDALDRLTARLAVSEDASVLDLHQASQVFRNSAHVLAQLRDSAARSGAADPATAAALNSYRNEMQAQALALVQATREQSDRLARAHQAAVARVVDAARTSAYWVVAWLAFGLVAAGLVARNFIGRHVIGRLQEVSRSLLSADQAGDSPPQVPVHGNDEIGEMARAVESFLSDRRELASTRTLLEAEQQRLAAIIDNTADSIVVLQGGRLRQLNRAAERMFGVSNSEAADQPAAEFLADFEGPSGVAPGTPRDAVVRRRDGSSIPVEVSLNPVSSGNGELLVLVIRDATLRKEAERHLIAARDAAESAREAQAIFLTNISHELRTPLNGILGFVQVLRRGDPLTARQDKGLRVIEESGQHLKLLIDDLLDLARLERSRGELRPTEIDLPPFMQAVCDIVRVKAEEKCLAFSYQPTTDLPSAIVADGKRLRQVLLNLLSNAVKFSDTGRVTLRAAAVAAGASLDTVRLRFEVEDQGIGMTEAQAARLFQPFAQVAEHQERREGGTGLGLAISQQLVRLMGGEIRVRSLEGQGCVFSFEIDVPVPQPPDHRLLHGQGSGTDDASILRGAQVLVVEDNPFNQDLMTTLLGDAGVEVSVAGDGRQAIEALEKRRFDAVLMDCLMPVMDGYEATRALRQRPALKNLPVIALTANAMVGDRDKVLAAGMNDYVTKPVEVDELLATLARWLRARGAEAVDPPLLLDGSSGR